MGWDWLANGKLLAAAEEAGFSIMVSADQNIWHQVSLAGRSAVVVTGSNHGATVRQHARGLCWKPATGRRRGLRSDSDPQAAPPPTALSAPRFLIDV